jgi:hypothetical protein
MERVPVRTSLPQPDMRPPRGNNMCTPRPTALDVVLRRQSLLADSQPIVLSRSPVLRAEIPHTIGTPGCPTVSYRPDPTEYR